MNMESLLKVGFIVFFEGGVSILRGNSTSLPEIRMTGTIKEVGVSKASTRLLKVLMIPKKFESKNNFT